jgi:predicted small secreted protein
MNVRQFLTLAICALLAGCDTSATLGTDVRQAGTSSETQTALQELADNVRGTPAAPMTNAAARQMLTDDRDPEYWNNVADSWISSCWAQVEELVPSVSSHPYGKGYIWYSVRNDCATDRSGAAIAPGYRGFMQARAHQDRLDSSGYLENLDGLYWRNSDSGTMTNGRWWGTYSYPSGFVLDVDIRVDPSRFPDEGMIETSRRFSFEKGRYLILDEKSLDEARRTCSPILDREQNAEIGRFCLDSFGTTTVFDAIGNRVKPRATSTQIHDSMGIRLLNQRIDGDTMRFELRIQTPETSYLKPVLTQLWVGGTLNDFADSLFTLPMDRDSCSKGIRINLNIPIHWLKNANTPRVELKRKYSIEHFQSQNWNAVASLPLSI